VPLARQPLARSPTCMVRRGQAHTFWVSEERGRYVVHTDATQGTYAITSVGEQTQGIDVGGRTVIPGLNDSHMHPIRGGLTYTLELRWDGVPSVADALRMLRAQAQTRVGDSRITPRTTA